MFGSTRRQLKFTVKVILFGHSIFDHLVDKSHRFKGRERVFLSFFGNMSSRSPPDAALSSKALKLQKFYMIVTLEIPLNALIRGLRFQIFRETIPMHTGFAKCENRVKFLNI